VSTWDRSTLPVNNAGVRAGDQTTAVYGGVQEISYSANYVYIRATGLGTHTMGPWYDDNATRTTYFASWPGNAKLLWRFPRTVAMSTNASYPSPKTATAPGACGLFANGVPLFNTSDTFSYSNASGGDAGPGTGISGNGDGVWNRDAFVNEGPTFDAGNSHQAMESHHYHANPPALRHLLGDSVDYHPNVVFNNTPGVKTNPYTENFNGRHSPIIGWVKDGLPIYGPYGYSDPTNASSTVRRMISGYRKRNGTNGSANLAVTGRTTRPQWSITIGGKTTTTLTSGQYGPAVSSTFVLGRYMEDYDYKGDPTGLRRYQGTAMSGAHIPATDFDLNEYNVRFCRTPEFPSGTWAYFISVEGDGTPVYPYNLAWSYFGDPSVSGAVTSIAETVTPYFTGAAGKTDSARSISRAAGSNTLTLTWDGLETAAGSQGERAVHSRPHRRGCVSEWRLPGGRHRRVLDRHQPAAFALELRSARRSH
jgi:YHYH protein